MLHDATVVLLTLSAVMIAISLWLWLRLYRTRNGGAQSSFIGRWQLGSAELAEVVANGGVVWFTCRGDEHPLIWIGSRNPFEPRGEGSCR